MKNFKNVMIGKVDINDKQIREGDSLEIVICKPSQNCTSGITVYGIVIYSYSKMAFCLKEESGKLTPLCNYAYSVSFKKI